MLMVIGMPEAGKRLGMSGDSARRALSNAEVPLIYINARTVAVEESDLQAFIKKRAGYTGRGRPKKKGPADVINPTE